MTPKEEQLTNALRELLAAIDDLPAELAYDLKAIRPQVQQAKEALKRI